MAASIVINHAVSLVMALVQSHENQTRTDAVIATSVLLEALRIEDKDLCSHGLDHDDWVRFERMLETALAI